MENSASAVTFTSPLGELNISHSLYFVHDQRQVGHGGGKWYFLCLATAIDNQGKSNSVFELLPCAGLHSLDQLSTFGS